MARWTARQGKMALTAAAGLAVMGIGALLLKPPPLTPVAVLTMAVGAHVPVSVKDITWVRMEHPPAGTVTAWAPQDQPRTTQALSAGTVLTTADFAPATALQVHPGEARYVVAITAPSAVVPLGSRVDVWTAAISGSSTTGGTQELAVGARVVGLYTANGVAVTAPATPGILNDTTSVNVPTMAALAVPSAAVGVLMEDNPGQTVALVDDPAHHHFQLVVAPASAAGPTTKKSAHPQ